MYTHTNLVVVGQHDDTTYQKYSSNASKCLGIFQVLLIFVIFCVSSAAIAVLSNTTGIMQATLGCIIFYLTASISAIVAGSNKKKIAVISSMLSNILGAVIAGSMVIVVIVKIAAVHEQIENNENYYYDRYDNDYNTNNDIHNTGELGPLLGFLYPLLLIYMALTIINTIASIIGCSVIFCGSNDRVTQPLSMAMGVIPTVSPMHVHQTAFLQQPAAYPQQLGAVQQQPAAYPQQLGAVPQLPGSYPQESNAVPKPQEPELVDGTEQVKDVD